LAILAINLIVKNCPRHLGQIIVSRKAAPKTVAPGEKQVLEITNFQLYSLKSIDFILILRSEGRRNIFVLIRSVAFQLGGIFEPPFSHEEEYD